MLAGQARAQGDEGLMVKAASRSRRWSARLNREEGSAEPAARPARQLPVPYQARLHDRLAEHAIVDPTGRERV